MANVSEVERLIAEERAKIETALKAALAARDGANEMVKALRAQLDAAPRLHVRRARKTKAARVKSLVEDSGYTRAEAKAIVSEDMDEGAPDANERTSQ